MRSQKPGRKIILPNIPTHSAAYYVTERNPVPEKIALSHPPPVNPYLPHRDQQHLCEAYTAAHFATCDVCARSVRGYLDACIQQLRAHERTARLAAEEQEREELHHLQVEYDVFHTEAKKLAGLQCTVLQRTAKELRMIGDQIQFMFETEKCTRRNIYREGMSMMKAIDACCRRTGVTLVADLHERATREQRLRDANEVEAQRQHKIKMEQLVEQLNVELIETCKLELQQRLDLECEETVDMLSLTLDCRHAVETQKIETHEALAVGFFKARVAFEEDMEQSREPLAKEEKRERHLMRVYNLNERSLLPGNDGSPSSPSGLRSPRHLIDLPSPPKSPPSNVKNAAKVWMGKSAREPLLV